MSDMYIMAYDDMFRSDSTIFSSCATACYTHSIEYYYGHLGRVHQVNNPADTTHNLYSIVGLITLDNAHLYLKNQTRIPNNCLCR